MAAELVYLQNGTQLTWRPKFRVRNTSIVFETHRKKSSEKVYVQFYMPSVVRWDVHAYLTNYITLLIWETVGAAQITPHVPRVRALQRVPFPKTVLNMNEYNPLSTSTALNCYASVPNATYETLLLHRTPSEVNAFLSTQGLSLLRDGLCVSTSPALLFCDPYCGILLPNIVSDACHGLPNNRYPLLYKEEGNDWMAKALLNETCTHRPGCTQPPPKVTKSKSRPPYYHIENSCTCCRQNLYRFEKLYTLETLSQLIVHAVADSKTYFNELCAAVFQVVFTLRTLNSFVNLHDIRPCTIMLDTWNPYKKAVQTAGAVGGAGAGADAYADADADADDVDIDDDVDIGISTESNTIDYIVKGANCDGSIDPTRTYRVQSTVRAVVFNFDSAKLLETIDSSLFEKQKQHFYPEESPYPRDDISTFLANCLKFVRSCPVQNDDNSVHDFFTTLFDKNNNGNLLFDEFVKNEDNMSLPDLTFGDFRNVSTPLFDDNLPFMSPVSLPTWYYAQLAGIRNTLHPRTVAD